MKPFRRRLFDIYVTNSDSDPECTGKIYVLSEIVDTPDGPEVHLWDIDLLHKGNNFRKKKVVPYNDLMEDYSSLYRYIFSVSDRYVLPGGGWFREVRMMVPKTKPEWITYSVDDDITIVMRSFLRADGEEYLTPYAVR